MRPFVAALAAAAALATAAPGSAAASPPPHCDEASVNVNCLDQGDDGTIYQCLVWYWKIEPENNPTCFPIF